MKAWMLFTAACTLTTATTSQASSLTTEIDLHLADSQELKREQIRKIYLGQVRHLDDGTRLKLTCLKKGMLHRDFLKQWVGLTPSQFKIHWQKRVFTGKSAMPYRFNSNQEQLEFVDRTPGAIGYKASSKKQSIRSGPSYFDPKTARYIKAKRS